MNRKCDLVDVSTHSRPKAAGFFVYLFYNSALSFNTQPPEGGWFRVGSVCSCTCVSTHSRPKAAGSPQNLMYDGYVVSTHSRPKAAGNDNVIALGSTGGFNTQPPEGGWILYLL